MADDAAIAFQKLHPRAFFERFVENGVRPDGRGLTQSRPVSATAGVVGTADGSSRVKLGLTNVVCGVRFLVGPVDDSNFGTVNVNVKLLPVCSQSYDYKSTERSLALETFLSKVLQSSSFLDGSQLVIEDGVASFHLSADVVCLSDDGNLEDASLLALTEALKDVRLPSVKVVRAELATGENRFSAESFEVVQVGKEQNKSLDLGSTPIAITLGLFGDKLLLDPTSEELEILDGSVTIVLNEENKVVSFKKSDGPALSFTVMEDCIDMAARMIEDRVF